MQGFILLSVLVAFAAANHDNTCPTLFSFFPEAADCTKFYRCFWGNPVAFQCPENTRWNQAKLTCDHAENVACGDYNAKVHSHLTYHPYYAAYAPDYYNYNPYGYYNYH